MKLHIMPHGWTPRETMARPKARFFTFLAIVWAAVALIGGLLLWPGQSAGESSELRRVAWLVLLPEPIFIALAVWFRFVERPRRVRVFNDWEGPVIH